MKRIDLWLFLFLWLMGCQSQPHVDLIVTETAVPVTPPPDQSPTAVSFVPIIPTPSPSDAQPPVAFTPSPPHLVTPTPTPHYPLYTGLPLDKAKMGVQIHIHHEDFDLIFQHLEALKAGWVKVQVSWKLYQPAPDHFDPDHFAELDTLVEMANARHMAVLLSVGKAPEWSRPTTELDGPPTDYALYQTFMNHLATRYRGRVAAYELWNEPNLQREWNGFPLSATDFVRLVQMGTVGVKTADSTALVISGAPAPTGINDGVNAIDDRLYLQTALASGLADGVDGIGAHPYGWANPPDSHVNESDTAVPSHNNHPSFFFYDTLWDYKALLNEQGTTKPIWVTEFGWGSFDGFGVPPPEEASFMSNVSEWQQAVYILRAYELGQEWEWVGPLMLWNLNFGPLLGTEFTESGYSLLRPDGSPRPAYLALEQAVPKSNLPPGE